MTRLAFIIGGDDEIEHGGTLQGVSVDCANYRSFLTSNVGGAWEHHEIVDLAKPDTGGLRAALDRGARANYALVAFAGHGFCTRVGNETFVCINGRDHVPVWELNTGATRQVTIIDACRTFLPEEMAKSEGRVVLGDSRSAVDPYRLSCRRLFDQAVMQAEEGIEILYAASPNQAAGDSDQGGYFTSELINGSIEWHGARRSWNPAAQFTLGVDQALLMAQKRMENKRRVQKPVGETERRHYHFPFAVA
jgi:hypothetical protein